MPLAATLHNGSHSASGPLTAAFYATVPEWGDWYIGSAFVPSIPANGTAQASIAWNTEGFSGAVPIRVVLDPYNRLAETNEANNEATATVTVLTKPELRVASIAPQGAARQGMAVNVDVAIANEGGTSTGAQQVSLYDGDPTSGGTLSARHR